MQKEKLAFERKEDYKGYNIKAWYLLPCDNKSALIEVYKDGIIVREFTFPAYKVWNIAAHFKEIIESEIIGSIEGIEAASWDGISGSTLIDPSGPHAWGPGH